jgi:hypothetical protein
MSKDNVDVGVIEALQRTLQALDNVLLGQASTHPLVR